MLSFMERLGSRVMGSLRGWDRLRLRGTFRPVAFAKGMQCFLQRAGHGLGGFGKYADWASELLCETALALTTNAGRSRIHLHDPSVSKEQLARDIARSDGITQGLICTLTAVEPCWTFRLIQKQKQPLALTRAYGKCLHVYHYLQHPVFGLMHLRLQSWMPFTLHLCLNGREWLARAMDQAGIRYLQRENCFTWVSDFAQAQQLLDQQLQFAWEGELRRLLQQWHPAAAQILAPYDVNYYWTIEESEWATDLLFASAAELTQLYPKLLRHGIETFSSVDLLRFLGQRTPVTGTASQRDRRQIMTDIKGRPEGVRIKHRLGENSVKLYNKQGSVLRCETTINNVKQLKVPRRVNGQIQWKKMRKGVNDVRRRAKLSDQANRRCLHAYAAAGTEQPLKQLTDGLSQRTYWRDQPVRGMNLLGEDDGRLLQSVGRGEFLIQGFRNRDLQKLLYATSSEDPAEQRRRSGQITRKIRLLRAHGLVHKLPHTHRYVVSDKGRQVIAALGAARNASIEQLQKAA
jgi:hypothetical protein